LKRVCVLELVNEEERIAFREGHANLGLLPE
jgi:hypothetical protein